MRNNKLNLLLLLIILLGFSSCGDVLKKIKNEQDPASALPQKEAESGFLPTDLKYISMSATQEDGQGFVISTDGERNKGKAVIEDGTIAFNIDYETFSNKNSDLKFKIDIFNLIQNGFLDRSFNTEEFSLRMDPGIYILTVTFSRGTYTYPSFKVKMIVKCSSTLANQVFTLDPSKLQITPVDAVWWPEAGPDAGRWVYFGNFQHSLINDVNDESKNVVIPPPGANLSLYTFNVDSNGDGTLEVANGLKLNQASYGIDVLNRQIYSKPTLYSTFADNNRFITYEVYDECFNVQAFEVATGNNNIFGITEKEDLTSPKTMPQMSENSDLAVDPSYMVQKKMSFLQQMQEESTECNDRSTGGVNYPQGCDTRLNGTLSLIPYLNNKIVVTCNLISNSSIVINAKETQPVLGDDINYNMIGQYGASFTINGIEQKDIEITGKDYIELDPSKAKLGNYTLTVPGTGDALGKQVLTTNDCDIKVLLPVVSQVRSECAAGSTGIKGKRDTTQNVRVAYHCRDVKGSQGKKVELAGELYCNSVLSISANDCVFPTATPNPNPTTGDIPITPTPHTPTATATAKPPEE